ncbi:MAG: guanitoxin biosynthesis MBL fold metallo-hydrolase GntH [Actinomycetota bacterium]
MANGSSNGVPAANPYGGVPGGGITLPDYFKPTDSVENNSTYFPASEKMGDDEMRISFVGSNPFPPRRDQAGTAIMVELGKGPKRFFFDLGPGCLRNIVAMQVPITMVNDIFITHLHGDHYLEIPYLYAFAAWAGRWKPLRIYGPSGPTPEQGTTAMIDAMKQMLRWHTRSFNIFPIGDGYEIDVTEFDYKDDGGVVYDEDGVVIKHWRRLHGDGASGYRLDWNGLSFVWTGDGRPDEKTIEMAKGADVFVTEIQPDLPVLQQVKMGMPETLMNNTVDTAHTPHYAAGYMMKQVDPKVAMVTHVALDEAMVPEMVAGIRTHYDGLFQFGAPDVVVVNAQKDAIWTREAALPEGANAASPSKDEAKYLFDIGPGHLEVEWPKARIPYDDFQDPEYRKKVELDKELYYPADVDRDIVHELPDPFKIEIPKMIAQKAAEKIKEKGAKIKEKLGR